MIDWNALGYNRFGQLTGYVQGFVENGLNIEMKVTSIKYDSFGRTTEQLTTNHKTGTETRVSYTLGDGTVLSPMDLSMLLEENGLKSWDQLLKDGVDGNIYQTISLSEFMKMLESNEAKGKDLEALMNEGLLKFSVEGNLVTYARLRENIVARLSDEEKAANAENLAQIIKEKIIREIQNQTLKVQVRQLLRKVTQFAPVDVTDRTIRTGSKYYEKGINYGLMKEYTDTAFNLVLGGESVDDDTMQMLLDKAERMFADARDDPSAEKENLNIEFYLIKALSHYALKLEADGKKIDDILLFQNSVKQMDYNDLGRATGYINVQGYSLNIKSDYMMDGHKLSWDELKAFVGNDGSKIWKLLKDGTLTRVSKLAANTESSISIRSNVGYNELGSIQGYDEKSTDEKGGVLSLIVHTELTYNELEQVLTTFTKTSISRVKGGYEESYLLTSNQYNKENNQLIGAVAATPKDKRNFTRDLVWTNVDENGEGGELVESISESGSSVMSFFTAINGMTKLLAQSVYSETRLKKGDFSSSNQNMFYEYDPVTGRLLNASGITFSSSQGAYLTEDGTALVPVLSTTISRSVFSTYGSQTKLVISISDSDSRGADTSQTKQTMVTVNEYKDNGRLEDSWGRGSSISHGSFKKDMDGNLIRDEWGMPIPNDMTVGTMIQEFMVINDEALLESQGTKSTQLYYNDATGEWVPELNGNSYSTQNMQIYIYDSVGRLKGVQGGMGAETGIIARGFTQGEIALKEINKALKLGRPQDLAVLEALNMTLEELEELKDDEAEEKILTAFNSILALPEFYESVDVEALGLTDDMKSRLDRIKNLVVKGKEERGKVKNLFGSEDLKTLRIFNKALLQALYADAMKESLVAKLVSGTFTGTSEGGGRSSGLIFNKFMVIMGQAMMINSYTLSDQKEQWTKEITFTKPVPPVSAPPALVETIEPVSPPSGAEAPQSPEATPETVPQSAAVAESAGKVSDMARAITGGPVVSPLPKISEEEVAKSKAAVAPKIIPLSEEQLSQAPQPEPSLEPASEMPQEAPAPDLSAQGPMPAETTPTSPPSAPSLEPQIQKQTIRFRDDNQVVGASLIVNNNAYLIGYDSNTDSLIVYRKDQNNQWEQVGKAEVIYGDDTTSLYLVTGEGTDQTREMLAEYDARTNTLSNSSERTEMWNFSDEKTGQGVQYQEMTVSYKFNALGLMMAAHGIGFTQADDGFRNITNSLIEQKYDIIMGQAKMRVSETKSFTQNLDGTWSAMGWIINGQKNGLPVGKPMTVEYDYNKDGEMIGARGYGESVTANSDASITFSTIEQDYEILDGQAKLTHTKTTSDTSSNDTETTQVIHVYYSYDNRLRLVKRGGVYGGKKDKSGNVMRIHGQ